MHSISLISPTIAASMETDVIPPSSWKGGIIGISAGMVLVVIVCVLFGVCVAVHFKDRRKLLISPPHLKELVEFNDQGSYKDVYLYPAYMQENTNVDAMAPDEVIITTSSCATVDIG